jgi:4-alpha-glucanotransferase
VTVLSERRCGVLLHVASLPGERRGEKLGQSAFDFIDLLAASGFSVWQTLPLGPVDQYLSPYQLSSAFAGNPSLVDPTDLKIDDQTLAAFCHEEASWLRPYAAFRALSSLHEGSPWWQWPEQYRAGDESAIASAEDCCPDLVRCVMLEQARFAEQWSAVRRYANERGILLFGDLPLYMHVNSADVWSNREYFRVSSAGDLPAVAGVPPDYFNAEGQRWGNPLFDWDALAAHGFDWWIERVSRQLRLFDLLRLDHFRGLDEYWEIPRQAQSAREGCWQRAPGRDLLQALGQHAANSPPLVAEDLGTITTSVRELRDEFGLPGMLVLQFAFDGSPDNPYLPTNHIANAVVYTGTHDNDTTAGWFATLEPGDQDYVRRCLGGVPDVPEALVEAAYQSIAGLCILPFQDLLGLGSEARLNRPGIAEGNWRWGFKWQDVPAGFSRRWRGMAARSSRLAD